MDVTGRAGLSFVLALVVASAADAQVIGAFSWQTQPYCNVLTLTVVQQGAQFHLAGSDDLCGTGPAPVTGTAVVAGGTVAMGMTVALPSGRSEHLTASITLATVSGPWNDADGHSGNFALVTASTGGVPRPAPTTSAVITSTQLAPAIFAGTGSAVTIARSDHLHDTRYPGRQVRLHLSGHGLQFQGAEQLGTTNGCATGITAASTGHLPLDVPFGATLTSVSAIVYDGTGGNYSLSLRLDSIGPTGLSSAVVASDTGGGLTIQTVVHTLTPTTPVVMGSGNSLRLLFGTGGAFANGLCSAEVNYTLPPAS